jgi:ATP-dependent DNA helicase PIF1
MLNEMRFGELSQSSINEFRKLSRPLHFDDGVESTELYVHMLFPFHLCSRKD